MMADKENRSNWSKPELHHWAEREWRKFITPDNLPEMRHWDKGTLLPDFHFRSHLARPHIRAVQRIVHAGLLPFLDPRRPKWPADAYPQRIPDDVVRRLFEELSN